MESQETSYAFVYLALAWLFLPTTSMTRGESRLDKICYRPSTGWLRTTTRAILSFFTTVDMVGASRCVKLYIDLLMYIQVDK
jgi:hypothetical protein